jgi:hypothetical protein
MAVRAPLVAASPRLAVSRIWNPLTVAYSTRCRLQVGDTADYKSALQRPRLRHYLLTTDFIDIAHESTTSISH